MRVMLAAGLLALAATGCCETCRLCRSDTPAARPDGLTMQEGPPPVQGNRAVSGTTAGAQPPAPAGRPAGAAGGVGAYGGTGY